MQTIENYANIFVSSEIDKSEISDNSLRTLFKYDVSLICQ
jgi:hypothetical protein